MIMNAIACSMKPSLSVHGNSVVGTMATMGMQVEEREEDEEE
jgi:hypothetical protein